jgi:hypothetical protein
MPRKENGDAKIFVSGHGTICSKDYIHGSFYVQGW